MGSFYSGHDDLSGFGSWAHSGHGHDPFSLGQEYLLSDAGMLSPISAAKGWGGHSGGGTSSTSSGSGSTTSGSTATGDTLVTAAGSNLAIDLVWDSSVAGAPSGFTSAVTAAVQSLVADLTASAREVVYIHVGWGEVAGQSMPASALGQSETSGYLTSYATLAADLAAHGESVSAANAPTSGEFFVQSAEAKALGMVSGASGGAASPDGYVGFSTLAGTGYSWQFAANGTAAAQYNLQAVVQHEISEVLGRSGMEGTSVYNGQKTYTALDLFDYSASQVLALANTGGYFSNTGGSSSLGTFNNAAAHGGDIGDWASVSSASQSGTVAAGAQDAFDAFSRPGYDETLSGADLLTMQALGYGLTPAGTALA